MIGRLLDNRYRLTQKIGSGGMSDVYAAEDILLDRIVAVKVLHHEYVQDEDFVLRFRHEAQAAAKLIHPNIVNIYDVGCDSTIYYIVMEYIDGETLKSYIERQGKVPNDIAVRISIEICEALEQAHASGIVHCDIKPHNIMVTKTGRIKVTDFGIARAVNTVTIINKDSVLGSAHYFSPEQAAGELVTAQTDIYSVGIVLYEMLTGCVPFEGKTPAAIALKHIQEKVVKPSKYNSTITPLLEECILTALEKDPEKRFESARDMIAELRLAQGLITSKKSNTSRHDFATGTIPVQQAIISDDKSEKENIITDFIMNLSVKRIIVSIAILFFVAAAIAFWAFGNFWSSATVDTPNVVGKSYNVAQEILLKEDLRVSLNEVLSESVPVGQVISQSPEAGSVVKHQRTIHLTVSKGGYSIILPNLIGMSLEEATANLKNIGLRIGKIEEREDKSQAFDKIIAQYPTSETKLEKGASVNVVVNKKNIISYVVVPDLKGMKYIDVTKKLKELGLILGSSDGNLVEGNTNINESDTVTEQYPSAGQKIVRGSIVKLGFSGSSTIKKTDVTIQPPLDNKVHRVSIVVTDTKGERIVYNKESVFTDSISHRITGVGKTRIQVFVDDNLVQDKEI